MWGIVAERELAAVRVHDGTAEGEAEAEASAAVGYALAAGIEHLKDLWLLRIRDARAVVGDLDYRVLRFTEGADLDV